VIGLTRRKPKSQEETRADALLLPGLDVGADSATATDEASDITDEAQRHWVGEGETAASTRANRPKRAVLRRVLVFGLLPGLAMLLASGAGYLKWQKTTLAETQTARIESVQAATDSTIKILSYDPETIDHDLDVARDQLTGTFRDAYTQLTHDVVIPSAKQKKISATATVQAAASISASPNRAVVMVFVNQTIVQGNDAPSSTASTVRVTLDEHDNRWLISDFTPI
jgi:Mce-associated membrane protein